MKCPRCGAIMDCGVCDECGFPITCVRLKGKKIQYKMRRGFYVKK